MAEATPAPRRSRWFQFSIRTLLALMALVGAYFAGFATAQKLAEKAIRDAQDEAAAELKRRPVKTIEPVKTVLNMMEKTAEKTRELTTENAVP